MDGASTNPPVAVEFNNLPQKALNFIFRGFDQPDRQKLRQVAPFWKQYIDGEFPVELVITESNYQRLFKCPNAITADIKNLTTEYTDEVAFAGKVQTIQFSGKVLTSNIFSILRNCSSLQALRFAGLKQVLGIQGTESIKLPLVKIVEIKVRPDQETFTSDEIIVISVLRQILFGSLNTILITTRTPLEAWAEEEEIDEAEKQSGTFTVQSMMTPMSMPASSTEPTEFPSFHFSSIIPMEEDFVEDPILEPLNEEVEDGTVLPEAEEQAEPQQDEEGTQTSNRNLHVIINRAGNFRGAPGDTNSVNNSSHGSESSTNRRVRYNISEFEARLFYANLELLVESGAGSEEDTPSVLNILNDSVSRTRMDSVSYFEVSGAPAPVVKHTVFFELVKNNQASLKNFVAKTRADFMCFGSIGSFSRDLPKVQFEEVEYSFGRMQVCGEYPLLRAQRKLKKLRVQLMDDMWKHLLVAIEQSQTTLEELDAKILSANEERVDTGPITLCENLKLLKLLHFYEKEATLYLPSSINKLIINGPVSYTNMDMWTEQLGQLVEFTLLLNTRGDSVDLKLYKKFLKMPNLVKFTFIQCPMDLVSIQGFIDGNEMMTAPNGFRLVVNGPKEIKELPYIQYVHSFIDPEKFNRSQIVIEEESQVLRINES